MTTSITIALCALTIVSVLVFLLYYKRTKRLLYRYSDLVNHKVDGAFRQIEARLVHGLPDFEKITGRPWAVMFTYDRKEMAMRTLETLREHEPDLSMLVIDNGSTDGTVEALTKMLREGSIQKVLFNTHVDVPQWQKAFALRQALKLLAMEYPSHIIWLDDDIEITGPFVREGIALLYELRNEKVKVINMTDDEIEERNHPTIKYVPVNILGETEDIKIRATFNGQFNIMSAEFFVEFGYPPISEGMNEWAFEDWFYSRQLQNKGYRAAVFKCANHHGAGANSKRIEIEKILAN
jgi:GT2 family glycosyltransferase